MLSSTENSFASVYINENRNVAGIFANISEALKLSIFNISRYLFISTLIKFITLICNNREIQMKLYNEYFYGFGNCKEKKTQSKLD